MELGFGACCELTISIQASWEGSGLHSSDRVRNLCALQEQSVLRLRLLISLRPRAERLSEVSLASSTEEGRNLVIINPGIELLLEVASQNTNLLDGLLVEEWL